MRCALALSVLLSIGAVDDGAKLEIEEWQFRWTVAKSGNVELKVIRDQDRTWLELRNRLDSVEFDAETAELLSDALGKVNEIKTVLMDDATKVEKCGEFEARFTLSKKTGFYVSVQEAKSFGSSVIIDQKTSKTLAPHLGRAKRMVQQVKQKINP